MRRREEGGEREDDEEEGGRTEDGGLREDWEGEAGRGGCRRASIFPPHISSSLISPPHPFSFLLLPSLQPSLLLHILPPPPTSSLLQWRPMKANGIQRIPMEPCGPMKRIPHARGEHAGFASWGEAAAP